MLLGGLESGVEFLLAYLLTLLGGLLIVPWQR